jgi:transcriptional activator HAC1
MWPEQQSDGQDLDSIDLEGSSPQSQAASDDDSPPKRKRKAWGQPIPDFEKLIGPRKRAKTEAEKTQRAHERTLRNRRAAAQSRDKKQAQFAAMEIENQNLRDQLAQYQARFGTLSKDFPTRPTTADQQDCSSTLASHPNASPESSYISDLSADATSSTSTLTISGSMTPHSIPISSTSEVSPTLGPTLQLNSIPVHDDLMCHQVTSPIMAGDIPDATQYSAAVLLDQQCQASTISSSLIRRPQTDNSFHLRFQMIQLTIMMTIFETFSSSMLTPMYQIFRTLVGDFWTHSVKSEELDQHFQLIHCLITSPMKGTARPVFRMKLLSRLLACNPITARHITVAADRALQRLATEKSILETAEGSHKWASLLTLRWTIKWLEREHARYRQCRRATSSPTDAINLHPELMGGNERRHRGIDYGAVERSRGRWDGIPDQVLSSEMVAH